MRFNIIGYYLKEGFRNTLKNKKSTSASLIVMCFTMLIFGVFFMIGENINSIMEQIESAQGIQVFINTDVSDEEVEKIGDDLKNISGVNTITFVSKEDALNQMKEKFKDKQYLLTGFEENNIFPASYVITLTDLNETNRVQTEIRNIVGDKLKNITSKDETVSTLIKIANGVRIVTGVILVFLVIISVVIISNTIKLTVHARRKEISIMKYVGATNSFIRWPFIIEGIVIGILAGALSILIVGIIYNVVSQKIIASQVIASMNISLLSFAQMFNLIVAVYLILGVGIGIIGSSISMRKYLDV